MTHVTCRLTAKNRDRLRDPTLGNRVWATFTFFTSKGREWGNWGWEEEGKGKAKSKGREGRKGGEGKGGNRRGQVIQNTRTVPG